MMKPNRVVVAVPMGMPYTPSFSRKRCSTMTSKLKPVCFTARGSMSPKKAYSSSVPETTTSAHPVVRRVISSTRRMVTQPKNLSHAVTSSM